MHIEHERNYTFGSLYTRENVFDSGSSFFHSKYIYFFFAFIAFGFFSLSLSRSRFFSVSRVLTEENSSVEASNVGCLDDSYNKKCRYISTHIALLYVVA